MIRLARLQAVRNRVVDEVFFRLHPAHAPIRRGRAQTSASPPALCLTFDDGPSSQNTRQVLDLLAAHEARATFFVVGSRISGKEELLLRMVDERHEIGNHTYSHVLTTRLNGAELREEVVRGADAIESASSHRPALARPPFGKDRRRFAAAAAESGARTILWSSDSGDAWDDQVEPEAVFSRVVAAAGPGAIVLLHDGGETRRTATLLAVERILTSLRRRGSEFVTVSELLRRQ